MALSYLFVWSDPVVVVVVATATTAVVLVVMIVKTLVGVFLNLFLFNFRPKNLYKRPKPRAFFAFALPQFPIRSTYSTVNRQSRLNAIWVRDQTLLHTLNSLMRIYFACNRDVLHLVKVKGKWNERKGNEEIEKDGRLPEEAESKIGGKGSPKRISKSYVGRINSNRLNRRKQDRDQYPLDLASACFFIQLDTQSERGDEVRRRSWHLARKQKASDSVLPRETSCLVVFAKKNFRRSNFLCLLNRTFL